MLQHYLIAIFLFLTFGTVISAQTTTYNTDFQIWNDTQFIFPLNEKKDLTATIWVFGRLGNTLKTVTDARIGGLLSKKINKNLTVSGGYLYRYSNTTFTQRRYESRYLGIAAVTLPLGKKFTLVNRNMYQYEDRNSRPDASIVRSRFWLKREITVAKKKIEPFVSFEPFYDFRLKNFARYRTQIGFSHKLNPTFSADYYYVRQDETGNGTRPGTLNGIGSSFRVNF